MLDFAFHSCSQSQLYIWGPMRSGFLAQVPILISEFVYLTFQEWWRGPTFLWELLLRSLFMCAREIPFSRCWHNRALWLQNVRWESNAHGATNTTILTDWLIKCAHMQCAVYSLYWMSICGNEGTLNITFLFPKCGHIYIQLSLYLRCIFVSCLKLFGEKRLNGSETEI